MSSVGYAVGIDLGTSNTVAIVRWPDGRTRPVLFDGAPVLPSAVFLDHDGTLRVGRDAQRMAQLDPARFEPNPKRRIDEDVLLLGDRELPIVDVLAAPLREIARAVTDAVGHLPPAVVTCPVAWGAARKGRLQQAAARAGWPPVHVVAEPIAAARYFTETLRRPVPAGGALAVFDFGGGTLDVALVRNDGATFTVVGAAGAEDLGGLDIDAAIVAHLGQFLAAQHPQVWAQIAQPADELARRHRRAFWDDVRAAKEMLSRSATAPVPVPGVSASLHLTRDELEHLATPLLRRATGELARALRTANLGVGNLSGIFLVGGTSRVPLLSRMLHTETGIAPTVLEQPELPVAEGAVAGSPAAVPAGAVPGAMPGAVVGAAPAHRTAPVSVPPISVPPAPAPPPPGPMWVTAGPPPRPPRRYRVWPWLLTIVLVLGGLCYGGYLVVKSQIAPPIALEHTLRIADLAPGGLHQTLVSDTAAYAIGQKTDGSVEVVAVDLATQDKRSYRSATAGGWSVAQQLDDWVAVLSVPAADGSQQMFVANSADDQQAQVAIANGETVTLAGTVGAPGGALEYFAYSAGANTVRHGTVDGTTNTPGRAVQLPNGARPLKVAKGQRQAFFTDAAGAIWRFAGGSLDQTQAKTPPGHPPALVHYDDGSRRLWVVENKDAYQVVQGGVAAYKAPAGRKPVWIGRCGGSEDICVLDEAPGAPQTREFYRLLSGGVAQRHPAPYAAVPGELVVLAQFVLLPMQEGERTGTLIVDTRLGTHRTYQAAVWPVVRRESGSIDAVLVPTRPDGEPATWAATLQVFPMRGLTLSNDKKADLGSMTAIPASCHVGGSRVACATDTEFLVYEVDG